MLSFSEQLDWMIIEGPNGTIGLSVDLEQAAAVMAASWRENNEQPLRYTPGLLQSYVNYPGRLPAIVSVFHQAGKLAAFVFGFPRSASLRGQELNLLLMTFFTVAPEFKGLGLGIKVWTECVNRARASGFDGILYYCAEGNRSNAITAAGCRAARCEPQRIFVISYLMRLLRQSREPKCGGAELDLQSFQSAAECILDRAPLARTWSLAEARWQCLDRSNPIFITSGHDRLFGALTGYRMQVADKSGTWCVFLEDVLWEHLDEQRKRDLVKRFVALCSRSAQVLVVPLLGYFSAEPFLEAGFRRSTRVLNAYLGLWDSAAVPEMPAIYMDVI
jgi:hypothetical protein